MDSSLELISDLAHPGAASCSYDFDLDTEALFKSILQLLSQLGACRNGNDDPAFFFCRCHRALPILRHRRFCGLRLEEVGVDQSPGGDKDEQQCRGKLLLRESNSVANIHVGGPENES